ncbi:hypothetical protein FQN50_006478 [Emmonsiellopsis sp. PD_5]|nr:hypothetical protein FQN50_006478 [Emmonsiellopsis sp. PD_5]
MDDNPNHPPPQKPQDRQRGAQKDEQPNPPNPPEPSQTPSMASRIQDSASGLLQNTFSGPSSGSGAGDLASTLAASLALSGKASSSHAPPPGHSSAQSAAGNISVSQGLAVPSTRVGDSRFPSESFRSSSANIPATETSEDTRMWEQFSNTTQNPPILDSYDLSSEKGKGKGKANQRDPSLLDPNTLTTTTGTDTTNSTLTSRSASPFPSLGDDFDSVWQDPAPHNLHHHTPSLLHHHQPTDPSLTDGAAVVSLLTSPTFQPSTFTPPESPQSELFELDSSMLDTSIAPQPAPPTSIPPATPNAFSLIPDIESVLSAIQEQQQQQQQQQSNPLAPLSTSSIHDQQHGTTQSWTDLPGVAEWLEVDRTYQDTVWGFLKPYTEAARKEVDERKEAGVEGVGDGPAVRRLGMVLGHLRERGVRVPG